jgi:hypothetical protein
VQALDVDGDLGAGPRGQPAQEVPVALVGLRQLGVGGAGQAGGVVDPAHRQAGPLGDLPDDLGDGHVRVRGHPAAGHQPVCAVHAADLCHRRAAFQLGDERGDVAVEQHLGAGAVADVHRQPHRRADGEAGLGQDAAVGVAEAQHEQVGQVAAVVHVRVAEQGGHVGRQRASAHLDHEPARVDLLSHDRHPIPVR